MSKEVEVARAILKKSPYKELHNVECMEHGSIILTGVVSSFFHKQVAYQSLKGKLNVKSIIISGLEVKKYS